MKKKLAYLAFSLVGLALGMASESAAQAQAEAADYSCCIYQGPYGLFCVNWYSGNQVDCMACPRGPQDCVFPGAD